jgi:cation transport ATPase
MSVPESDSAATSLPSSHTVDGEVNQPQVANSSESFPAREKQEPTDRKTTDHASVEPGWKLRTAAGAALLVIGAGAVPIGLAANSESVLIGVGSVLAALSLVLACLEASFLVRSRPSLSSGLSLFPVAGVVLVCLAFGAALLSQGEVISGWLVAQAPLLCGMLLLLRGLATRSSTRGGRNASLLFPASGQPLPLVEMGQALSLSEGMVVPADLRIESGSCAVLERYLSPLPHFRIRDEAEIVLAGSFVLSGTAQAIALSSTKESVLAKVEGLVAPCVEESERTAMVEYHDWVRNFALCVAFLAVAAAISWDKRSGYATDVLLAGGLTLFLGCVGYLVDVVHDAACRLIGSWARKGFVSTLPSTLADLSVISKVVVDPSRIDAATECQVRELEILDDRIGREALCGCVISLLGRADDMALAAAGDYCQTVLGRVASERVLDLREYEGRGTCGSVKGVEISIGTEDFIVERGIMLQPSDIVTTAPGEGVLLVAIDNDVIARFWLRFGQGDLIGESVMSSWPEGVTTAASSGIQGEITPETLLVRGNESEVIGRSHALEVARFGGERFELPKATLVMLSSSLRGLPVLLSDIRAFTRRAAQLRVILAGATLVCLVAIFGGLLSALVPVVVFGALVTILSQGSHYQRSR